MHQGNLHEALLVSFQTAGAAGMGKGSIRSQWLTRADRRLVCLRSLLRLAHALQLLGGNQLKYAAERLASSP